MPTRPLVYSSHSMSGGLPTHFHSLLSSHHDLKTYAYLHFQLNESFLPLWHHLKEQVSENQVVLTLKVNVKALLLRHILPLLSSVVVPLQNDFHLNGTYRRMNTHGASHPSGQTNRSRIP